MVSTTKLVSEFEFVKVMDDGEFYQCCFCGKQTHDKFHSNRKNRDMMLCYNCGRNAAGVIGSEGGIIGLDVKL